MSNSASVYDCSVIELRQIQDRAGSLTPVTVNVDIPFKIPRIFYIYDIPGGKDRGGHAHKELHEFLVAVSGSFEVELADGKIKRTVVLNRPYFGLHVLPGIWAAEKGFSSGAVCLVLTSDKYDETDYIKGYSDYLAFKGIHL